MGRKKTHLAALVSRAIQAGMVEGFAGELEVVEGSRAFC